MTLVSWSPDTLSYSIPYPEREADDWVWGRLIIGSASDQGPQEWLPGSCPPYLSWPKAACPGLLKYQSSGWNGASAGALPPPTLTHLPTVRSAPSGEFRPEVCGGAGGWTWPSVLSLTPAWLAAPLA